MTTQYLTCKFKLHNPSRRKRDILIHAMREYTIAYQGLLDWSEDNLDIIISEGMYRDSYSAMSIRKLLPRIDAEIHSSMVDSLQQDVAQNLASFLELAREDTNTGWPIARTPDTQKKDGALDRFSKVGASIEDYNEARDYLLSVSRANYMPLTFARPDGATRNRNFSLLRNTEKYQYFALLYLLPGRHELCQPVNANKGNLVRLDTNEVFTSNSRTAILVPIEIGRNGWQYRKFVEQAEKENVSIKSAKLSLEGEDFYIHVAFEFECEDAYKPEAYLGIDMGILFTAAYALVNDSGGVVDKGHFDDKLRELQIKHGQERERIARNGKRITSTHYKTKAYENILHVLANKVIELAKQYSAQIVIEDLNVNVRGGRVVSRFRKFGNILNYKCNLEGVPMRSVFAAYSSMICHKCGAMMERNDREVVCHNCGHEDHSDDNAAVNMARRAMYRKKDWEKRGGYKAFHRSFSQT